MPYSSWEFKVGGDALWKEKNRGVLRGSQVPEEAVAPYIDGQRYLLIPVGFYPVQCAWDLWWTKRHWEGFF
jgi:hypothetical protein